MIMDFLWILNPDGLWISYGMDMDLVSNPSGPLDVIVVYFLEREQTYA